MVSLHTYFLGSYVFMLLSNTTYGKTSDELMTCGRLGNIQAKMGSGVRMVAPRTTTEM
jgi:hypothetical protein